MLNATDQRHHYDLQPSEYAVFCLDAKMAGIGSNNCGPALDPMHQVNEKEMHFCFRMEPIDRKED